MPADSFSPASLTFTTPQGLNTPSTALPVTLTNTSTTGTLFVTSIIVGGSNPGDFQETNNCLPEGRATSRLHHQRDLYPIRGGPRSANVTITDNAPGSPHVINLSGTGALIASTAAPGAV